DEKAFSGTLNQFSVFKKFDWDNDGYISPTDLRKALERYNIAHTDADVKSLMQFLDFDMNGYVDFAEFTSKIRPNCVASN
ncbi:MAG: EF-hand domain-containing protein, partial [Kangiellaceae bacterium]|nr:EF-hand domain-containing protein [Kangiellaceae bacterium]